ncbi:MAG: hypothetical protein D3924_02675 [Candidatus Electrothrix sp. AR4]|nr:hypothetical protein [Candidatus Electrothrix sp. AR4]
MQTGGAAVQLTGQFDPLGLALGQEASCALCILRKQRDRVIPPKGLEDIIDPLIIRCIHILSTLDDLLNLPR